MIAALLDVRDRLLGRGAASISVPVFDGALKSNRLIEDAETVATLEAPEDLGSDGRDVFVADGKRIVRMSNDGLHEVAQFDKTLTALACLGDGAFAVALEGREVLIRGGRDDGRRWDSAGGKAFVGVNAISVAAGGKLLVTEGSHDHPHAQWKRDLMSLGRTGRVVELASADGTARELAAGLGYAFGACAVADQVWLSESWRHHVARIDDAARTRLEPVTDALPGYPSRLVPATGGGVWLTCFALRTQLVEFVLREHRFRKRMLAEIDPAYWVAPALNSGNTFLEPMQGAQLKMMGIVKPWAPPRSYGLVVRLTEQGLVRYSLHSRYDGKNHGITAAADCGGLLYLLAKGRNRVLRIDIGEAERSLSV